MKRVLLVEDSVLVRTIVCDALETCFPCVTTVLEDGAQAWAELSSNSYDLIITDIMMPKMDGLTLARKVRDELRLDIPIIVLTSITADNVRAKASEAGVNAYLTKPVDYNQLIKVVERLVTLDGVREYDPEEE